MNSDACIKLNLAEALRRLPGTQKENVVTVFEHGSLVTKLYAPRVIDPETPHSRDEVYVVAQGFSKFICRGTRQSFQPLDVLFVAAGVETVSKSSRMISRSGLSSMATKAAKSIKARTAN